MVTSSEYNYVGAEIIRHLTNNFVTTWWRVFIVSGCRSSRHERLRWKVVCAHSAGSVGLDVLWGNAQLKDV